MARINLEAKSIVESIDSLSALKDISTSVVNQQSGETEQRKEVIVNVSGYGLYEYDRTSTETADDVLIVEPNDGNGRWYRRAARNLEAGAGVEITHSDDTTTIIADHTEGIWEEDADSAQLITDKNVNLQSSSLEDDTTASAIRLSDASNTELSDSFTETSLIGAHNEVKQNILTTNSNLNTLSNETLKKDGSVELTANWDAGDYDIKSKTLTADELDGTAPLNITSTTRVDNLNADMLDGKDETEFAELAGRAGGQSLRGSDTTAETLTLKANAVDSGGEVVISNSEVSTNVNLDLTSAGLKDDTSDGTINLTDIDHDSYNTNNQTVTGSVNEVLKHSSSTGLLSGGSITDAGSQTFDVASGTALFRESASETADLYTLEFTGLSSVNIADNDIKYVGAEYNAGVPTAVVKDLDNWDNLTEFRIGEVIREGTTLYISNASWQTANVSGKILSRFYNAVSVERAERDGGLIIGETGTRNITLTAGALYDIITRYDISAFDTSGADTFNSYVGDTLSSTANTKWDNLNYNNGGTLTELNANYFANLWFYVTTQDELVCVYGVAQYDSLAGAEEETVPETVPLRVENQGVLVGRLVFQKSASTAETIQSAFRTFFSGSNVTSHNNLSGLQGGVGGEYYHLEQADYNALTDTDAQLNALHTNGDPQFNTISSTVATGVAPLSVSSETQVNNLNAELHGGISAGEVTKLDGRAGGQTLQGGDSTDETLTLKANAVDAGGNITVRNTKVETDIDTVIHAGSSAVSDSELNVSSVAFSQDETNDKLVVAMKDSVGGYSNYALAEDGSSPFDQSLNTTDDVTFNSLDTDTIKGSSTGENTFENTIVIRRPDPGAHEGLRLTVENDANYVEAGLDEDDTDAELRITRTATPGDTIARFKVFSLFSAFYDNVAIGTTTENTNLQLDVQSSDKGFAPPRMTKSTIDGLLWNEQGAQIYNTDTDKLYINNGSSWSIVKSGITERYTKGASEMKSIGSAVFADPGTSGGSVEISIGGWLSSGTTEEVTFYAHIPDDIDPDRNVLLSVIFEPSVAISNTDIIAIDCDVRYKSLYDNNTSNVDAGFSMTNLGTIDKYQQLRRTDININSAAADPGAIMAVTLAFDEFDSSFTDGVIFNVAYIDVPIK